MSVKAIENLLQAHFKPDHLVIEDLSSLHAHHQEAQKSGGGHYRLTIVSQKFSGLKKLERHRLIYSALEPLKKNIHALSISDFSPAEWDCSKMSRYETPALDPT